MAAAPRTSAANKLAAERDAARLLTRMVLPLGAVRLSREPYGDGGLLERADSTPSGLVVDRHRRWLVPEPLAQAVSFVHAHAPRGSRHTGTGYSSGTGIPKNKSFTFSFPAIAGRLSSRQLEVTLVALPHHRTGIRADAQETWLVPRPASEKVPAAVRVVDIRTKKAHVRVKKSATVQRIVRLFDSLPIVQPGRVYGCPPDTIIRPPMSIRFLSADGALLAHASVPGSFAIGACAPIRFWIGSQAQKPLSGHLYGRLSRLLGVRFG
jgi:hypothetical protein